MNKNLLIINRFQFGYHTDYYKYCQYLKDEYCITFLCFDSGRPKLEMQNVNIRYVPLAGFNFLRGLRYFLTAYITIMKFNGVVFVNYFEYCYLLKKLIPHKKMILDIRTLSINKNENIRNKNDYNIGKATKYFDYTTIISEGLRQKLNIDNNKSAILPLGADVISSSSKDFTNDIRLLYVGTLNGRNIAHTITGLSLFLEYSPLNLNITYNIVGEGDEFHYLQQLIKNLNLEQVVKLHGRIPHFEITPFFDKCNIGISYVPMTSFYEYQPVTKTFEYILSGMPCIATNTYENKLIVSSLNGVLCDDNPESFSQALLDMHKRLKKFRSETIRNTLIDCTWENIVKNIFKPILFNFNS